MYSNKQWEQHVQTFNSLLRENGLQGNILCKNSQSRDQKGFWYFSSASSRFLGDTAEEAKEAILTIIECVKEVNKPKQERTGRLNVIKKLFGSL
jgi:hypothetical protein